MATVSNSIVYGTATVYSGFAPYIQSNTTTTLTIITAPTGGVVSAYPQPAPGTSAALPQITFSASGAGPGVSACLLVVRCNGIVVANTSIPNGSSLTITLPTGIFLASGNTLEVDLAANGPNTINVGASAAILFVQTKNFA